MTSAQDSSAVPGRGPLAAAPDGPTVTMERIWPWQQQLEPYDFYRPEDPSAPLLRINMVASLDGLVTDTEGRSGGLGGTGDLAAFRALRAMADGIIVGAGTARAEGYGTHRLHTSVAERRRQDGRTAPAAVVVVSQSLDLDPRIPLFTEAVTRTVVLTSASAPRRRREELEAVADVVVAGAESVDLDDGLDRLRERGLRHLLCEGGPRLNTALLEAGRADELCLTIAPRIVGLDGPRLVAGTLGQGHHTRALVDQLQLLGLAIAGNELFTRYAIGPAHEPIGP